MEPLQRYQSERFQGLKWNGQEGSDVRRWLHKLDALSKQFLSRLIMSAVSKYRRQVRSVSFSEGW